MSPTVIDIDLARKLGDLLPEGMVVVAADGSIIFVNVALCELVGRDRGDIIGEKLESFLSVEDLPVHLQRRAEYFADLRVLNDSHAVDLEVVHADGHLIPVSVALSPWPGGGVPSAIGVVRDMTKEVDAFEKEASRQRHFKILSDVTGAMAAGQNDPSAVLEVATRELADAIGDACVVSLVDDRREHLVPTVFHHRDPKGEEVLREVYLKASARVGQGLAGEVVVTGKPVRVANLPVDQLRESVRPEYRPYIDQFDTSSLLIVPLTDGSMTIGTLGLSREAPYSEDDEELAIELASRISLAIGRAGLAEQVNDSYRLLQTMANNLPAMIGYWDSNLRNVFANSAYTDYFGLTPAEIKGRHLRDVVGHELFAKNVEFAKDALKGNSQHFDRELLDPAGVRHYTNISYVPHVVSGAVVGIFVLVVDQTDQVLAAKALTQSEQRYRVLAENSSDVVWRLSMDGIIEWVSPQVGVALGQGGDDLAGADFATFLHEDDCGQFSEQLEVVRETGATVTMEARFRTGDQVYRWVSIQARAWRGSDTESPEIIVGMRDAQHAVEGRRLLEQNERLLRLTIEQAPQGTAVFTLGFDFLRVNEALCESLERDRDWLFGHTLFDLLSPEEADKLRQQAELLLSGDIERADYEMRIVLPSGAESWLRHTMALLIERDSRPGYFVSHMEDVTVDRRRRRQLEYRVQHDPLTGLLNREALQHELVRLEVERTGPYAVLYCDLDYFKDVNDIHGHQTGDDVLVAVAERLRAAVRRSDVVARLGGDEFVIILRDVDGMEDCERVAALIHQAMRLPIHGEHADLTAEFTIGVCLAGEDTDPKVAIACADEALYAAKWNARGTTRFVDVRDGVPSPGAATASPTATADTSSPAGTGG